MSVMCRTLQYNMAVKAIFVFAALQAGAYCSGGSSQTVDTSDVVNSSLSPRVLGFNSQRISHGQIRLELYTRQNPEIAQLIDVDEAQREKLFFNPSRPTKVAIHGWMSKGGGIRSLRAAFLEKADVNFIAVNWTKADNIIYPLARLKVKPLARLVAQMLDYLHSSFGLKMTDVHILGHSLGSHIAGCTGNFVKYGRIGRITGLDPAGPLFSVSNLADRLSADDAQFVDVIHTCAKLLGFKHQTGHMDFYPNGGTSIQPGCFPGDIKGGKCSHNRAYDLFVESVKGQVAFKAWPCDGVDGTPNITEDAVLMGLPLKPLPQGDPKAFCLRTSGESPFVLPDDDQLDRESDGVLGPDGFLREE